MRWTRTTSYNPSANFNLHLFLHLSIDCNADGRFCHILNLYCPSSVPLPPPAGMKDRRQKMDQAKTIASKLTTTITIRPSVRLPPPPWAERSGEKEGGRATDALGRESVPALRRALYKPTTEGSRERERRDDRPIDRGMPERDGCKSSCLSARGAEPRRAKSGHYSCTEAVAVAISTTAIVRVSNLHRRRIG